MQDFLFSSINVNETPNEKIKREQKFKNVVDHMKRYTMKDLIEESEKAKEEIDKHDVKIFEVRKNGKIKNKK